MFPVRSEFGYSFHSVDYVYDICQTIYPFWRINFFSTKINIVKFYNTPFNCIDLRLYYLRLFLRGHEPAFVKAVTHSHLQIHHIPGRDCSQPNANLLTALHVNEFSYAHSLSLHPPSRIHEEVRTAFCKRNNIILIYMEIFIQEDYSSNISLFITVLIISSHFLYFEIKILDM